MNSSESSFFNNFIFLYDECHFLPIIFYYFAIFVFIFFSCISCIFSINSLRSLAMDLDEGLGSHVEEFARQMETPKGPGGKLAAASNDDDDDSDYGDFDEDEFGDIDVNK